jgi:tetratricopeptide (TPR) repeat protein
MNRMPYRGGPGGDVMLSGGAQQKARIALSNNQPAVAEDICRRRLEKKPDEASTRLLLAQALIQLQRGREAAAEARTVLRSQPNSVEALITLSTALMANNQAQLRPPQEALSTAEQAVKLQPKQARTHVQLAEVYYYRRDYAGAREQADEAIKLDPRQPAAFLVKALVLLQLKDYEGALQASQSAIRLDRMNAQAYLVQANAQAELKHPEEALEALALAQRYNPTLPRGQVVALRSQAYRKVRRYRAAYQEYVNLNRETGRVRFAPLLGAITFALSFFGDKAPFVIIPIVVLILFGISRIPFAGGPLIDAILIVGLGVAVWSVTRMQQGATPLALVARNSRTLALAAGALVLPILVVFLLSALIAGRTGVSHGAWLTPLTVGLAGVLGVVGVGLALNLGSFARQ